MADAYSALRIPAVRRFVVGRFISSFGRQMASVAIGWQIYERTNDPFALGMVGLAQVLPILLLSLPAGHFVDRHNRRDVLLFAQIARAVTAAAMVWASHTIAPLWIVYTILAAGGCIGAFEWPSASSLLAQVTPREHFINANAWRSTSFQLANTVGPATAGFLLAAVRDPKWVYAIDAGTATLFFLWLSRIPRPETPPALVTESPRRAVAAGLSFLLNHELLFAVTALDMFAVVLAGAEALMPIFARDVLHVGPHGLGWLRAAPAIGALTAAILQTRLPSHRRSGLVMLVSVAAFSICIVGFGLSTWFPLSLLFLFLSGAFDNLSVVIRITIEQMVTPDALRGRVASARTIFVSVSNELGEFESGLAAALFTPVGAVVGGGLAALAITIYCAYRWPALRRLGRLADISSS